MTPWLVPLTGLVLILQMIILVWAWSIWTRTHLPFWTWLMTFLALSAGRRGLEVLWLNGWIGPEPPVATLAFSYVLTGVVLRMLWLARMDQTTRDRLPPGPSTSRLRTLHQMFDRLVEAERRPDGPSNS